MCFYNVAGDDTLCMRVHWPFGVSLKETMLLSFSLCIWRTQHISSQFPLRGKESEGLVLNFWLHSTLTHQTTMSLGYAEKLSYIEDVGNVGMVEYFDPSHVLREKVCSLSPLSF